MWGVKRRSQIGAQFKKLMLERAQDVGQFRIAAGRQRQADDAVKFIHLTIGFHTQIVFGCGLSAEQVGLSLVASPSV